MFHEAMGVDLYGIETLADAGRSSKNCGHDTCGQRDRSRTRMRSFRLFVLSVAPEFVGRLAERATKLAAEVALIGKAGIGGHFGDRTL